MSTTWMPLFTGDYLKNTLHLSTEEHGAYFLLIIHYWAHGKIKNDQKTLKNITKISSKKLQNILPFFEEKEGYLVHDRIETIKLQAAENIEKQRKRTEKARLARHSVTDIVTDIVTTSTSTSTSTISINIDIYIKIYAEVLGKKILKISDKRKKSLQNFAKKYSPEEFNHALQKVKASTFMQQQWTSWDIDWIINENNFIKIMEGKYDGNGTSGSITGFNGNSGTETRRKLSHSEIGRIEAERIKNALGITTEQRFEECEHPNLESMQEITGDSN